MIASLISLGQLTGLDLTMSPCAKRVHKTGNWEVGKQHLQYFYQQIRITLNKTSDEKNYLKNSCLVVKLLQAAILSEENGNNEI